MSLSGKYALSGAHTKNGYDLALRRLNKRGGVAIAGTPYELVIKYYDDESTPARGTELAERLIKQDGVKYILGPFGSGQTKAMLPVIEKYRAPMVESERSGARAFHQGLPPRLRRTLHLGTISRAGHRACRKACREAR